MLFVLAVSATLKQMAFDLAPASLTEKSQFLRPITFGRIGIFNWIIIHLNSAIEQKISDSL